MHGEYEIYEVLPTGHTRKVSGISGLESATAALHDFAKRTSNECLVVDLKTRQVVAQMNVPAAKWRATKHIFQISYDEESRFARDRLLRSKGYSVISVVGNEKARLLLSNSDRHFDLFIVGHSAPAGTRKAIVDWLKAKYPEVKILALIRPHEEIASADFNLIHGSDSWMALVTQQVPNSTIS